MPDRAQLAEREQLEALRRSSRAAGVDAAVPVADEAALVREAALAPPIAGGQGVARAGVAGMPRGMSPAMLMSMQRFAGNRATVQAVGLFQKSGSAGTKKPEEEKEPLEEDASAGPESAGPEAKPPKETSAAAGPPDGGGLPGGSAPPPAGGATGGATGGASGGAGSPGGPGDSGSSKSGTEPTVKPPALEPEIAGSAKSGTEPTTKPGPIGGTLGGAAGAAIGAGDAKSGTEPPAKPADVAGVAGGAPGGTAGSAKSGTEPTTKPGPIGGTLGGAAGAAIGAGETKSGTEPPAKPDATAGLTPGPKPTGTAGAGGGGGTQPGGGDHVTPPGGTTPGGGDHVVPPGPTGTAGPTAPPASVPLGPHGLPDPETAKSGIDWNQILSDYGPPVRTVLEVGRLIPGWGLLAGFGADALNFQSDLASIPKSENADLATGLIVFRNFVNIGNNGLGHILYVNQLIQDGLAGSVVGAEFTPLTAAANEVLSGVKVGLDEVQMGTDIVIEVEALYESNHAPTSAEAEQWKQLADGYAANLLGDVVNITLDIISLASAGAANTAPVQQARQPLSLAGAFMKSAVPNIIGGLNGVIGVWLGNLMTAGRHAYEGSPTELREQALIYDMAGGFVDHEAGQARMTYSAVDAVIGAFEAYADQQVEQLNTIAGALSGGKTAFQLIRDAVQSGLEDMHNKLSMVEQLASLASNAQTNAAAISACLRHHPGGARQPRHPQLHAAPGGARGQRPGRRDRIPREPGHGCSQCPHPAHGRERPVAHRRGQGRGARTGRGRAAEGRQPRRMAGAAGHRERGHGRHPQRLHRQVQRGAREVHQRRAGDGPDHRPDQRPDRDAEVHRPGHARRLAQHRDLHRRVRRAWPEPPPAGHRSAPACRCARIRHRRGPRLRPATAAVAARIGDRNGRAGWWGAGWWGAPRPAGDGGRIEIRGQRGPCRMPAVSGCREPSVHRRSQSIAGANRRSPVVDRPTSCPRRPPAAILPPPFRGAWHVLCGLASCSAQVPASATGRFDPQLGTAIRSKALPSAMSVAASR